MDIAGRVALVTGAGGEGTGRATALRLAADGARVVVADIDGEGARETARRIEQAGGSAAPVRADVSVEPDVRALIGFAEERFGGLDVLVNNAGGTPPPHHPDAPSDHWGRTLALNLTGPMLTVQHALPAMERRGGGAVVNVASVAGLGYRAQRSPEYSAAKAGLIHLSAALGSLAARSRVRVNCVVPEWILTADIRAYLETLSEPERANLPARITPPEEIAAAIAHLASDETLAGRVLVCWCDSPWALVDADDRGYERFEEVTFGPGPSPVAASRPHAAAR